MTAELNLESYLLRRYWWVSSMAQWHLPIMCKTLGLVTSNIHTYTQTHTHWVLVPVYMDSSSLGKRVSANEAAKMWPEGGSTVTGVYRTAKCGHRDTYGRVPWAWVILSQPQSYRRWQGAWSNLPCTCGGCPCQHLALCKQLWVALCSGSPANEFSVHNDFSLNMVYLLKVFILTMSSINICQGWGMDCGWGSMRSWVLWCFLLIVNLTVVLNEGQSRSGWACLWVIILIMLIDMWRPSLEAGGTLPWVWVLDCIKKEKAS